MPSFYIPSESISSRSFRLTGTEARHILRVLRKHPGDKIHLFDGSGRSYLGTVEKTSPDAVQGSLLETVRNRENSLLRLCLYPALPKGDKLEWILEKGTEVGVERFVPTLCERCVPRPFPGNLPKKMERWRKIVLAACKQSDRDRLGEVYPPLPFREALAQARAQGLVLLAGEKETSKSLPQLLREIHPAPGSWVHLFVGPEGGFSPSEVARAKSSGAHLFSLGPHTLRTETAAILSPALLLALTDCPVR